MWLLIGYELELAIAAKIFALATQFYIMFIWRDSGLRLTALSQTVESESM